MRAPATAATAARNSIIFLAGNAIKSCPKEVRARVLASAIIAAHARGPSMHKKQGSLAKPGAARQDGTAHRREWIMAAKVAGKSIESAPKDDLAARISREITAGVLFASSRGRYATRLSAVRGARTRPHRSYRQPPGGTRSMAALNTSPACRPRAGHEPRPRRNQFHVNRCKGIQPWLTPRSTPPENPRRQRDLRGGQHPDGGAKAQGWLDIRERLLRQLSALQSHAGGKR